MYGYWKYRSVIKMMHAALWFVYVEVYTADYAYNIAE